MNTWKLVNDARDETYPRAEALADSMRLPLVACPVHKELYGTVVPVLDEDAARRVLSGAGHLVGTPAHDAAMEVLRHRARGAEGDPR
jgi:hypothetical protein